MKDLLNTIAFELDKCLINSGFKRTFNYEWCRPERWKQSIVDIDIRRAIDVTFLVSLRVVIPTEGLVGTKEWPYQYLAQENVPRILGKESQYTKCPKLRFFQPQFVKSVVKDVEASLTWFQTFSTPEQCLLQLSQMFSPDSDAYKDAYRYLTRIQQESRNQK